LNFLDALLRYFCMKGRLWRTELHSRRKRREKVRKLRQKYLLAKNEEEREKIIAKALRVNKHLTREQFLEPIKGAA